jgi:hypothetical protein
MAKALPEKIFPGSTAIGTLAGLKNNSAEGAECRDITIRKKEY